VGRRNRHQPGTTVVGLHFSTGKDTLTFQPQGLWLVTPQLIIEEEGHGYVFGIYRQDLRI
jgi:hypothetical protein